MKPGHFEKLAEARIREWQAQRDRAPEAEAKGRANAPVEALEVQLLKDVLAIRERLEATRDGEERARLERAARELELRLMVLLENSGRSRAAERLAEHLRKQRPGRP